MALRDVSNKAGVYVPSVSLDCKYSPLIKRGRHVDEQCKKFEFASLRNSGSTNIDLWVDGGIYPTDPLTGVPPPFRNTKSCLEFVCHGECGLLGYTKRLADSNIHDVERNVEVERILGHCQVQTRLLESSVRSLQHELGAVRGAHAKLQEEMIEDTKVLEATCGSLRQELERADSMNHELKIQNQSLQNCVEGHSANLVAVELACGTKVRELEIELKKCKDDFLDLQRRISTLKHGPFGLRHRIRDAKGLDELSWQGGQAKARRKLVRTILQPQSVATTQAKNKADGGRRRLYGDKSSQLKTALTLAKMLSKDEVGALVEQPRMGFAATRIANNVLQKISEELGPDAILAACDQAGVSHRGYGHIYKTMKGRISLVNKDLKANFMPKPHKARNSILEELYVKVMLISTLDDCMNVESGSTKTFLHGD